MPSRPPVQLYAKDASGYSLLSWRPEESAISNYLAVPGAESRRKLKPPTGATGELPASIEQGLRQQGGVWAKVERSREQFNVTATSFRSDRYSPPARLFLLSRDSRVEARTIDGGGMSVRLDQFVLLPVDQASEQQLQLWLDGVDGLSGDLRQATVLSIMDAGILDSRIERPTPTTVERRRSFPLWAAIALTAILALGAGIAAGYAFLTGTHPDRKNPGASPSAHTRKDTASGGSEIPDLSAEKAEVQQQMVTLEASVANSKTDLSPIVENHIGALQLSFDPLKDLASAQRIAESWMIVKLAMRQQGMKPAITWSRDANESAAQFLQNKFSGLDATGKEAIRAAFCYADETPPGTPRQCAPEDWKGAAAIAELGKAVLKPVPTPGANK